MEISLKRFKLNFINHLNQVVSLSAEQKEKILHLPIFSYHPKGSFLFKKGDNTSLYYFVIKGGVRIYELIDGKDVSLSFIIDNEPITPESTIFQEPSDKYAVCFEDTILVSVAEELQAQIEQEIPVFQKICRKFTQNMWVKKQRELDRYKTLSPEQRYQYFVKERPHLLQRVPQYHIATYLGIRPESLSRIRSRITTTQNF